VNRRGFLGSILALGAAPAIVRADSLMRILPMERLVLSPLGILMPTGAMREMWAYDIVTDDMIRRFDVIVRDATGAKQQLHVSVRGDDAERDRAPALASLRSHIERIGGQPIGGILKIPAGMEGRIL
jgi:hypothetical protein